MSFPTWLIVAGVVAPVLAIVAFRLSDVFRIVGGIGVRRPNPEKFFPDCPVPPRLAREGLNTRDVHHTAGRGEVKIRAGRLLRGAVPAGEGVVAALVEDHGVRTLVDLRGRDEANSLPYSIDVEGEVTRIACPAVEKASAREHMTMFAVLLLRRAAIPWLMRGIYSSLINAHASELGSALRVLADPDRYPVYIHCSVGKDRTGILVATALALCGVPDQDIVRDYAVTNHAYDDIHTMYVRATGPKAEARGVPSDEMRHMWIADPAWIQLSLDKMRKKHGSVRDFVVNECGLNNVEIAAIRSNIVA